MSEDRGTIRVYMMPREMPCGPGSSCCGPIGQSAEEIEQLRLGLQQMLPGVKVEIINIREKLNFQRDAAVLKVIQAFGAVALPLLAVNGQILSMGPPNVPELVSKLKTMCPSLAEANNR